MGQSGAPGPLGFIRGDAPDVSGRRSGHGEEWTESGGVQRDVSGNEFRLMCAVHFNTGMVFALRFLSHAEYSKNTWKNEL